LRRRLWRHDAREDHLSWHFYMQQFRSFAWWTPAWIYLSVIASTGDDGRTRVVVEARSAHRRRPPGTPMHFDFGEPKRNAARVMRAVCESSVFPPELVARASEQPGGVLREVSPRWDKVGEVPLEAIRGFWKIGNRGEPLEYRANALYHPEVWEDDEVIF
jgi:hypothetical protein